MADSLAPEVVAHLLRGRFGYPYRYSESCASTQQLFGDNDPEGAIAATELQTEGRGRLGRAWHAPARTSILLSVLLRPSIESARLPELSPAAGHAVADAIRKRMSLTPTVKFPNDVLIGGRKVAGVLAEADERRVVIGIGVNVNQTSESLPHDTPLEATSLRIELGHEVSRAELLATILDELERTYERWLREVERPADVSGSVGR